MIALIGSPVALFDIVTPSPIGDSSGLWSWFSSFLITLGVELVVVALLWRRFGRPIPVRTGLMACLVANLLSHPLATVIWFQALGTLNGAQALAAYVAMECGVVLLEAIVYRSLLSGAWRRAFSVSLLANAPTALLGAWLGFFK